MAAGGWLRERLDDDWTMHHVVPHGYEAYARVFHPAEVRSLPDRPMPTPDEWVRMPDAERERLFELVDVDEVTWADAAEAFGTTMHALAQWYPLVRGDRDGQDRMASDGREFTGPGEGRMPASLLARIAGHLVAHTSTPDAGYVAVWEGWGGLIGGHGTNGRGFIEFTDGTAPGPSEPRWWSSLRANFENPFRKAQWHPGILSDEISKGPRLALPDRDHVLFSAAPSAFADPEWILDAPWRDREAEAHGFEPEAQHPSILWPDDRAWVMVSEIDFDSTIVAGSTELVRAICADAGLEALPISEGASLHWDADEINR
jgi:hypothetical protein